MTTDQQSQQPSVNNDPDQPIDVSRGQLAFETPAPSPEDEISDVEKRLQGLEISTQEETQEASQDQSVPQQEPEAQSATDSNLPTLDQLTLPEDVGVEAPKEVQQLPDTPEAKKFAEDFQKYLGFSVDEFRSAAKDYQATIEYMNQVRQEQYINQSVQSLSKDWGVDATETKARLEKVQERFGKYNAELQSQLDSIEGAKLIWAKLEQEARANNEPVPTFQKSKGMTSVGNKPLFTKAEINNMSKAEYERNADRILYAYANGLIK